LLLPSTLPATPIPGGQQPGTSGLRAKVKTYMSEGYLLNFLHCALGAMGSAATPVKGGTLVVGGDGRYFAPQALQMAVRVAVAHGVNEVWVGRGGLLSTPAASALVREGHAHTPHPSAQKRPPPPFGALILSASHNPAGVTEDFGIKINGANGAPAPSSVTQAIGAAAAAISSTRQALSFPPVDLATSGVTRHARVPD
jgi:phosphoglucomutase